jgi:hypothetical protein
MINKILATKLGFVFIIVCFLTSLGFAQEAKRVPEGIIPYHFVDPYYFYDIASKSDIYNSDIFLTIDKEPNPLSKPFYYWSKNIWFKDGNLAYFGLQTNGMIKRQWVGKLVIFSVWNAKDFQAGPKSSCEKFDGEGEGLSCRQKYDWQEGHKYRLRIWYVNDSWWAFYIKDMNTEVEDYIGKIKAPSPSQINGFALFYEYFTPVKSCEDVPYAKATFSNPTANGGIYKAKFYGVKFNNECKNINATKSGSEFIAETGSKVSPFVNKVRSTYFYDGGYFIDKGSGKWENHTTENGTFYFNEVKDRDKNFVILLDKSRPPGAWIALPKEGNGNDIYFGWNGQPFKKVYEVKW